MNMSNSLLLSRRLRSAACVLCCVMLVSSLCQASPSQKRLQAAISTRKIPPKVSVKRVHGAAFWVGIVTGALCLAGGTTLLTMGLLKVQETDVVYKDIESFNRGYQVEHQKTGISLRWYIRLNESKYESYLDDLRGYRREREAATGMAGLGGVLMALGGTSLALSLLFIEPKVQKMRSFVGGLSGKKGTVLFIGN
ncbi:MAG TPA: hypothetical protein DCE42_14030 [Myxococcales bacterium]|nr:hypothetical protein [Deltaproteobacteria bacterium]HAA55877.1 hypothetical protein [Myxococcales bacterium]